MCFKQIQTLQITTVKDKVMVLVTQSAMDILTTRSKCYTGIPYYSVTSWIRFFFFFKFKPTKKCATKNDPVQKCFSYLSDTKLCNKISEGKSIESKIVSSYCGCCIFRGHKYFLKLVYSKLEKNVYDQIWCRGCAHGKILHKYCIFHVPYAFKPHHCHRTQNIDWTSYG